jgi:tetratricopeptide (TPR) repeat protein
MRLISFGIVIGLLAVACTPSAPSKPKIVNIDKLYQQYPDSLPIIIAHGTKMLDRYDYSAALKDGAKAYRMSPSNLDARYIYASALNNRATRTVTDVMSAQTHFKYILKRDPKNLKVLIAIASTYSQQGDFKKAFGYINEALRINKKYRDAYIMKGTIYLSLGDNDKAKSSYQTALDQDPNFYEAALRLGLIYQSEGDRYCIEYFTTATQLRPNSVEALYNLAYAYQEFNQFEEALATYRLMQKKEPTFTPSLFQQGYIKQFNQNQIDSAMYFYNSCLSKEPRYVEAWNNLGLCYETKGDRLEAIKYYKNALKYDKDFTLSKDALKRLSR